MSKLPTQRMYADAAYMYLVNHEQRGGRFPTDPAPSHFHCHTLLAERALRACRARRTSLSSLSVSRLGDVDLDCGGPQLDVRIARKAVHVAAPALSHGLVLLVSHGVKEHGDEQLHPGPFAAA